MKNLLKKHKASIVCLFEPEVPAVSMLKIQRRLSMTSCWNNVDSDNHIWVFWNDKVKVRSLVEMDQVSSFEVIWDQRSFVLSCVYGSNNTLKRRDLWNHLLLFSDDVDCPCIVGGDFNVILSSDEAKGSFHFDYPAADDFRDFMDLAGLAELSYWGDEFSWSNNRKLEDLMFKKLDRVLVNQLWKLEWDFQVYYENRFCSDHSPLIVQHCLEFKKVPSRFVFQSMWVEHSDFQSFVKTCWMEVSHSKNLKNLSMKLKHLKGRLKCWNKDIFEDVFLRWDADMSEVSRLESELLTRWDDASLDNLVQYKQRSYDSAKQLELFLRQKSREDWLECSDKNTKYFHAMVKERKRRLHLEVLLDTIKNTPGFVSLLDEGKKFYQQLLSSEGTECLNHLFGVIPSLVTDEQNAALVPVPTCEEVKSVIFSMERDHSPGPDGFTAYFYQVCWDLIANDVFLAVKSFFQRDAFPLAWKSTFISLIPKKEVPTSFKDMRPISLCNVSYKIVSKILTNRLSMFMPSLILEEQGDFVQGRNVSENVSLVHELVQCLKHGKSGGNLIIKLDMEKAYDRVEWNFLEKVLVLFGFSQQSIGLLSQCFRSNVFSVLINGESS